MLIAKDMYNADQTRKEAERSYTVSLMLSMSGKRLADNILKYSQIWNI